MEVVELEINYIEMVDHFCNIMNDITKIQSEITGWKWREKSKPDNELLKRAEKDNSACYWSFDRGYYRAQDVKKLIEFKDEPDFPCYALSNIRDAKARIENFLEDSCLTYPDYDLNKYDSILEDYYNKEMLVYQDASSKYTHLTYLRTNINLGICHDIDHCYELLNEDCLNNLCNKEEQYLILDEIVKLVKQLYGFKPPKLKDDNFVKYERWK